MYFKLLGENPMAVKRIILKEIYFDVTQNIPFRIY